MNRTRKDEFKRKLVHILLGTIVLILFAKGIIDYRILGIITIAGMVCSLFQHIFPLKIIKWFLDHFDREERIPGRGAITFMIGLTIAALFPKEIALAAIAILTWGDGMATIVGKTIGNRQLWLRKTIEGSLAFLIFGFIAAWIAGVPATTAFIAAFAGMLIELIPLPQNHPRNILDDNVMIPVLVGLTLLMVI